MWGERVECVRAPAGDRIALLHGNRGTFLPPRNPQALLELAALPFLELRRPRDWASLPEAADRLLQTLA